jgi:hypothetical protein
LTRTKLVLAASLALATLIASAPAQAATRNVEIGMQTFADRCIDQGGLVEVLSPVLSCETASVRVDCAFVASHEAECSWPGIDNRVAVNRLIGGGDAESLSDHTGIAKKGGVKLPDLPIKWK